MKVLLLSFVFLMLASCTSEVDASRDEISVGPAEPSVSNEIEPADAPAESSALASQAESTEPTLEPEKTSSRFWGVAPGEPVELKWDDLLPAAAEEEYLRQQAEFFATLEQRYAENSEPFSEANKAIEGLEEGSALDVMPQFGTFDAVEEFNNQLVRIPGYIVPLDFGTNQRLAEFLFVPYMGACLHTPPPPPNQIIFVQADPEVRVKDIWVPYWAEGTLQTEENRNEMGDAAYTLKLERLESYNYE